MKHMNLLKSKLRSGNKDAKKLVAVTAAATVLISGLFSTPADIIHDPNVFSQTQVVQVIDDGYAPDNGGDEDSTECEEKRGIRAKLRRLLLRLPLAVRLCILLPLWLCGTVLTFVCSQLLRLIAMPLLLRLLKFFLFALIAAALLLIGLKLLFPGIPLRSLLTKRNLIIIVVLALFQGAICACIDWLYPEKAWLPPLVNLCCTALSVLVIALRIRLAQVKHAS